MQKIRSALSTALLVLGAPSALAAPPADVGPLRTAALEDKAAWDFVEGLTTEIGPRPAGTPREARAREWAVQRLTAMGFANVRIEDYRMPVWVRGEEKAAILSPFPQKLAILGLGNSGSTSPKGIEGEVAAFSTLAELEAVPDGSLKNKIVYIGHAMRVTQDGSSYGYFGVVRRKGPSVASRKGAAAVVIRSIGTDNHRVPHTGVQNFDEGVTPIPAGALSNPDADQLERALARGKPVTLALTLVSQQLKDQPSGNVIAEVPGSDLNAGVVLAACHLDSWDPGTGAVDDAAGCAIIYAAAKLVKEHGQPRRTIRLLLAGAEEVGIFGGSAYFAAHAKENHVLAMESDFGADRVWRVDFKLPEQRQPLAKRIVLELAPLGVGAGPNPAGGGADIAKLVQSGVPVIDLQQDGSRYFDLHHTADDTLDKVDPTQLRQNVAAWTTVLILAANEEEGLQAK
jgi:hypothetical protein